MIFETQEQLDACLSKWQRILRLQDWEIRAQILAPSKMARRHANAECAVYAPLKRATISLCKPAAYKRRNDPLWPLDMERLLVHELLHIPIRAFAPDEEDEPERYLAMEQFVETCASSFVAVDRSEARSHRGHPH